jgi:hypothetical protein
MSSGNCMSSGAVNKTTTGHVYGFPGTQDPDAEDITPVHQMIARDPSVQVLERRIFDLPNDS